MEHFDVAIAGGGPAGATTAITLSRLGRRVLLADGGRMGLFPVGEALTPSATSLLKDLGLYERFLMDNHRTSFGNVSAWGGPELRITDFIAHPAGPGYQLDRARFDAMLLDAARGSGASVCSSARLALDGGTPPLADDPHQLCVTEASSRTRLTCLWLVDAGGRSSILSQRLNATRNVLDRLVGISILLASPAMTDEDARSWVEADAQGWWYSTLLPSGKRLVTYLTDADIVDHATLMSASGFTAKLQRTRHLSKLCNVHRYAPASRLRGSNAASVHLKRSCGNRWLAVGDAALAFDPLSSQGLGNALYTGMLAGLAIEAAIRGDDESVPRFAEHLDDIFRVYVAHRNGIYAQESRWCQSEFWRRRHELQ